MYFELDNKTFCVKFYRTGTTTIAELFEVGSDNKMTSTGVYGIARVYHTDRFEKSKGRKIALADLIWQRWGLGDGGYEISKEQRKMLWDKYFERHNK